MNMFIPKSAQLCTIALWDYYSGLVTIDRHTDHRGEGITVFGQQTERIKLTWRLT